MQIAESVSQSSNATTLKPSSPEIVIIGTGPIGIRAAQEVIRRDADAKVILYGKESGKPYNRALLTSLLFHGAVNEAELTQAMDIDATALTRHETRVTSIDRYTSTVTDERGQVQRYSSLILATGSTPYILPIPGISLPNVFTFYSKQDLEAVLAYHSQHRRTLVLGGGVLGLEIAIAIKQRGADVAVVESSATLMSRQLDQHAAALLKNKIKNLGINVMLNEQVEEILGDDRVHSIRLASGKVIDCDCIILAVGVRSNNLLASNAGLHTAQGIIVDDTMRTNDANIFAIGDCAQHRGKVYGLLAPGFEQASIAAQCALGANATYLGSTSITRLKVGLNPLIIVGGRVSDNTFKLHREVLLHSAGEKYRQLVLHKGLLVGATLIENWELWGKLQEAITRQRRLRLWERMLFRFNGSLWNDHSENTVSKWSEHTIVCNCMGITRGQLSQAIMLGDATIAAISQRTGAGTVCKSCVPLLAELAGQKNLAQPLQSSNGILVSSLLTLAVIIIFFGLNPVQVPIDFSQHAWQWDPQSRDISWNRLTGFVILGLIVCSFTLLLRKRWHRVKLASFDTWRTAHGFIGVMGLIVLAIHTGLHTGSNFNTVFLLTFISAMLAGAIAGIKTSLANKRISLSANQSQAQWSRIHTFVLWPMSVLLGFHILSNYYF